MLAVFAAAVLLALVSSCRALSQVGCAEQAQRSKPRSALPDSALQLTSPSLTLEARS
jgi:hypothetical protein